MHASSVACPVFTSMYVSNFTPFHHQSHPTSHPPPLLPSSPSLLLPPRPSSLHPTLACLAEREHPSDEGPARDDLRTEHLVRRVDHTAEVADQVRDEMLRGGLAEVLQIQGRCGQGVGEKATTSHLPDTVGTLTYLYYSH